MKNKTLLTISIAIFIISLIPIYFVGSYCHPSVDDYYYGSEAAQILSEGGTFTDAVSSAAKMTRQTYYEWQGNFSAIFLMRLQPGIFGDNTYVIAPMILITTFIVALMLLVYNVMRGWFKAGKMSSLFISLAITFAALQFTYVPSDSFYWYNGGIYYTFFFSLMCILLTLITSMLKGRKLPGKIISAIFALPLAFIIGGGNYSTALYLAVILAVMFICLFINNRRNIWLIPYMLIAAAFFAGFIISIKAPGNAIRTAFVNYDGSIIKALLYSFAYGGYVIGDSTTFPVAIMWILLFPLFYRIAKRTGFKFRFPLLVLIISFGIFSSQGTALFYAQGIRMPYRMSNIIYFNYYIFMMLNLIYLAGWLARKFEGSRFDSLMTSLTSSAKAYKTLAIVCSAAFIIGCIGLVNVSESENGSAEFTNFPLTLSAAKCIVSGEGKTYDEELSERSAFLEVNRGSRNILTVPALSETPDPIFHSDITEESTDWKNMHLLKFYDLMHIVTDPSGYTITHVYGD